MKVVDLFLDDWFQSGFEAVDSIFSETNRIYAIPSKLNQVEVSNISPDWSTFTRAIEDFKTQSSIEIISLIGGEW